MSVHRKSHGEASTGPGAAGTPEAWLQLASRASDPAARAKFAISGLCFAHLAADTHLLLLRQLCLSHLERGRHYDARAVAQQMVALGAWPEIAHQEAARACAALGDFAEAVNHLRLAGRAAPASRRGFHLWCLGSTLYALDQHSEALEALERAERWATKNKPLIAGVGALCRRALAQSADLSAAYAELSDLLLQPGIAEWVGGELLLALGRVAPARRLLERFVSRLARQPAKAAGLRAELERARRLISTCPTTAS